MGKPSNGRFTRRTLLQRGGALGAALSIPGLGSAIFSANAMAAVRAPDSLPDPRRPAGTATEAMPFDRATRGLGMNACSALDLLPKAWTTDGATRWPAA